MERFVILACLFVFAISGNVRSFGKHYNFDSRNRPAKHTIDTVPYHQQITDYACGDASSEMVLNYFGVDVNQYSIMDVLRTSFEEGTLSTDIVRGAHFSPISSSVGFLWPQFSLTNGYPGHPFGLASFWYDNTEPWLDFIKTIVANDIPVIVLMHFDPPANITSSDGHFRVIVGYDDTLNLITMNDPWSYDGYPPIAVWSYENFIGSWNYIEHGSPRVNPYFAAVMFPWTIEAEVYNSTENGVLQYVILATVEYPCPSPFDCSVYGASNTIVSLSFPVWNMILSNSTSQSQNIGNLYPGNTATVKWILSCSSGSCEGSSLSLKAQGVIAGSAAFTYCCGEDTNYPAYDYTDIIGGTLNILL